MTKLYVVFNELFDVETGVVWGPFADKKEAMDWKRKQPDGCDLIVAELVSQVAVENDE